MSTNPTMRARLGGAVARAVAPAMPFCVARADNAQLWDVEGRAYIDFSGGAGVLNVGHRHPRVVAAVHEQLDRVMHTSHLVAPTERYVQLAERLNELAPGRHDKRTAFFTSGSEAVEAAIRMARTHTGRPGVIAFQAAAHGHTYMALAATGRVDPHKRFGGPLAGHVYHVPTPSELDDVSVQDMLAAIDTLFRCTIDATHVAAVIVEPVQGAGGCHVMPPDAMQALRRLCDTHRMVLIADESHSGLARTGRLFATEHSEVVPDLTVLAKSLGGGLPLSAVTGCAQVMGALPPGSLGGTFGGNPLAAAAAHAVLDVIRDERLCERAERLGALLRMRLGRARHREPHIAEVRGLGSMVGVEFQWPSSYLPDAAFARAVQAAALEQGLMLLTCGAEGNVIRFLYPLTIPDAMFEQALGILSRCMVREAGTQAPVAA